MATITIKPGRPFWSGFTAFCANMIAILGLNDFSITEVDLSANWGGAIVASLFVAAVVYGKAKIDEKNGKDHGSSNGPSTATEFPPGGSPRGS
jgi:hypothetical protein